MSFRIRQYAVVFGIACLLPGCSQVNVNEAAQRPELAKPATEAAVAPTPTPPGPDAQPSNVKLVSNQTAATPEQPAAATEVAAVPAVAAGTTAASFTDTKGIGAEPSIASLAQLGVLDQTSGTFKPFEPITRGEYVRWVVKAINRYSKDANTQIRLAETPDATFVDVKPNDPDFKYIQGLANSGFVVGVDATHFAPTKPITREEMIMIKAQLDENDELKPGQFDKRYVGFSDVDEINPDYIGAMYHDGCATTTRDITRIWGSMKTFHPKKPVTRSEAAISVSETRSGTAKATLEREAKS
jgi:hypothetical protein